MSEYFPQIGLELAMGNDNGTVLLWDVENQQELHKMEHIEAVEDVAFSPDGKTLASASGKAVYLWNTEKGDSLFTLEGYSAEVRRVLISNDGKTLIALEKEYLNMIYVWDIENHQVLPGIAAPVLISSIALSPNAKILALGESKNRGDNSGSVYLLNMANHQVLGELRGHSSLVYDVVFNSDEKILASGSCYPHALVGY